jgi:cytochrome oxidase assembly protein ShyY1
VSDGFRLLLTPRWLGLTLVALVAVGGFGLLSHWQWDRAHRDEAADAAAADPAPVPVASLLPGTGALDPAAYGRSVTVTGVYEAGTQRLVPRGSTYFVIAALRQPGGAVVPVVRGTVSAPPAPPVPGGTVTVTGRLQPYDGDPGVQASDASLPPGQLARIAPSALTPVMGPALLGGWVTLSTQDPPSALPVVVPAYSTLVEGGLLWQNATYAVEWVVFAGFVVFMWVRWFRDELAGREPEQDPTMAATDTGAPRSAT